MFVQLGTLEYSVPTSIANHVNFVQPTTRFGIFKRQFSTNEIVQDNPHAMTEDRTIVWAGNEAAGILEGSPNLKINATCNITITPQYTFKIENRLYQITDFFFRCLHDLYNVHYKPELKCNTLGYGSFLEEFARYSDLEVFEKKYIPYATGANVSLQGRLFLLQALLHITN